MKKNYWVSWNKCIADWYIAFDQVHRTNQGEALIHFTQGILSAGVETQIYMLKTVHGNFSTDLSKEQSYPEFMKQCVHQTGILPFFSMTMNSHIEGKICYYNQEKIAETEIANLGALMKQLHPEIHNSYWMRQRPPVWLSGAEAHLADHRTDLLSICLYTDLWFPKVMGWLEEEAATDCNNMYDNQELALCHTPRLNRFLTRVYDLTQEIGAEWNFSLGDCHKCYQPMLTEKGIQLD